MDNPIEPFLDDVIDRLKSENQILRQQIEDLTAQVEQRKQQEASVRVAIGDVPYKDDDIPAAIRAELMHCAISNGRISYYYLCHVWRRATESISEEIQRLNAKVVERAMGKGLVNEVWRARTKMAEAESTELRAEIERLQIEKEKGQS